MSFYAYLFLPFPKPRMHHSLYCMKKMVERKMKNVWTCLIQDEEGDTWVP